MNARMILALPSAIFRDVQRYGADGAHIVRRLIFYAIFRWFVQTRPPRLFVDIFACFQSAFDIAFDRRFFDVAAA